MRAVNSAIIHFNNQLVSNFRGKQMTRFISLPVVCLLVSLAACSRPEPVQEPVRSVKLVKVGDASVGFEAEFAADIRARVESRLGFRVGGKLTQRLVESGQVVRAGQVLAVIDPQDYQLAAQAAAAQVVAAQTQRDLAAADLKRFEALRDQGFVSGAEIERRQATLRAAEATFVQAKTQASVQGNQAAYTQLVADTAGVVVGVEAEAGQVVSAGATVVRLARQGPRDAVLAVPEDLVMQIKVGQPAVVKLWAQAAMGEQTLNGRVREVAASADPATRTYTVKVALPDAQQPPLGATAKVRLQGDTQQAAPKVVKLPATALWQQGSGSAVWVFDAKANTVKARTVQVAGSDGLEAVITAGLQPGEEVVSAGVHVLTEGQEVTRYAGAQP